MALSENKMNDMDVGDIDIVVLSLSFTALYCNDLHIAPISFFQSDSSTDRIKNEVQSENTHINWALFKQSKKKLIVLDYGHGGADIVREHLKSRDNEVVYGLMRFTFDFLSGSKMSTVNGCVSCGMIHRILTMFKCIYLC